MAARLAGLKRNFNIAATSLTCMIRLFLLDRSNDWTPGGRSNVWGCLSWSWFRESRYSLGKSRVGVGSEIVSVVAKVGR